MRWLKAALSGAGLGGVALAGAGLAVAGGGSGPRTQAAKATGLHRLRLRRLQRAEDRLAGRLARLALPRARHLHRRRQPRLLERPAHARLDRRGRLDRLEPDPALRRPPGAVRRRPGPREDLPDARLEPGHRRGRRRRRATPPRSASPRAARSTSTWRATRSRTRAARRPCSAFVTRLGRTSCTRSATSPASTAAPPRRSATCRRSPRPPRSPTTSGSRNWNGDESVFGRPVRLRQPSGRTTSGCTSTAAAHHETWGGVTIDIDSNYVDAAVVGAGGTLAGAGAADPRRRAR